MPFHHISTCWRELFALYTLGLHPGCPSSYDIMHPQVDPDNHCTEVFYPQKEAVLLGSEYATRLAGHSHIRMLMDA